MWKISFQLLPSHGGNWHQAGRSSDLQAIIISQVFELHRQPEKTFLALNAIVLTTHKFWTVMLFFLNSKLQK
jgi:hypothetical protein